MGSSSSVLLLSLIEDILDLSKMEAGTFSINITTFNSNDLMEEVYDIFYLQIAQKRLELILDVDPILAQAKIDSDRGRIKQVLLNLISNSLKFTFNGSITISAKVKDELIQPMLEFGVIDTGVGIKEEDQAQLFKLFGMAKSDRGLNPNG